MDGVPGRKRGRGGGSSRRRHHARIDPHRSRAARRPLPAAAAGADAGPECPALRRAHRPHVPELPHGSQRRRDSQRVRLRVRKEPPHAGARGQHQPLVHARRHQPRGRDHAALFRRQPALHAAREPAPQLRPAGADWVLQHGERDPPGLPAPRHADAGLHHRRFRHRALQHGAQQGGLRDDPRAAARRLHPRRPLPYSVRPAHGRPHDRDPQRIR